MLLVKSGHIGLHNYLLQYFWYNLKLIFEDLCFISTFLLSAIQPLLSNWVSRMVLLPPVTHEQILFYIKVHKEISSVLFKYGYFTYISTCMFSIHGLINKGWVSKDLVQLEYLLQKTLRQLYTVEEFHISKL